jgi:hypothetical protein
MIVRFIDIAARKHILSTSPVTVLRSWPGADKGLAVGQQSRHRRDRQSPKTLHRLPARSPNLNSYAERWVRSVLSSTYAEQRFLAQGSDQDEFFAYTRYHRPNSLLKVYFLQHVSVGLTPDWLRNRTCSYRHDFSTKKEPSKIHSRF